jgi:hypothetical protein
MNRLWRRLDVTVTLIAQGERSAPRPRSERESLWEGITNPGSYLTACD